MWKEILGRTLFLQLLVSVITIFYFQVFGLHNANGYACSIIDIGCALFLWGMSGIMLVCLQGWLMWYTESIKITELGMIVLLLGILLIPRRWCMYYPISWGMWLRSRFYMVDGFSPFWCAGIELLISLAVCCFGYRRRKGRSER